VSECLRNPTRHSPQPDGISPGLAGILLVEGDMELSELSPTLANRLLVLEERAAHAAVLAAVADNAARQAAPCFLQSFTAPPPLSGSNNFVPCSNRHLSGPHVRMEGYNLNHCLVRPAYEHRHQPTLRDIENTLAQDSPAAVVFLSIPLRVRRHWKQAKLLRRY
jgi:hypothetical protein